MKKKFLVVVVLLFLIAFTKNVYAACKISCYTCSPFQGCPQIPSGCWYEEGNYVERICIVGDVSYGPGDGQEEGCVDAGDYWGCSCYDPQGYCGNEICLATSEGYNGATCEIKDRCFWSGCGWKTVSGKWDASEDKCVKCDSKIKK